MDFIWHRYGQRYKEVHYMRSGVCFVHVCVFRACVCVVCVLCVCCVHVCVLRDVCVCNFEVHIFLYEQYSISDRKIQQLPLVKSFQ